MHAEVCAGAFEWLYHGLAAVMSVHVSMHDRIMRTMACTKVVSCYQMVVANHECHCHEVRLLHRIYWYKLSILNDAVYDNTSVSACCYVEFGNQLRRSQLIWKIKLRNCCLSTGHGPMSALTEWKSSNVYNWCRIKLAINNINHIYHKIKYSCYNQLMSTNNRC